MITNLDVHPSLHPDSHHQITLAKFNLEILFLLPYFRNVWHHQDANTDLIRQATSTSDWDMAFMNTNDNEKVFICKETVLNIFSNFIPHETSIIGDKDPPWFPKKKSHPIESQCL